MTALRVPVPVTLRRLRIESAVVTPVAIGLATTAITIAGAWIPSSSMDETATASAIARSLPDLFRMTTSGVDAVHAAYYVSLHLWSQIFGSDLFSLRAFSALGVGVAAAGTVRLGQMIGGLRLGLLAGLIFITLPMTTWAGTEARSYAWVIAATAWATVALLVAVNRGGRWWAVYAATSAAACALFIYSALVLVTHVLAVWLLTPSIRRRAAGTTAAATGLVAASPVVLLAYRQRGQVSWIGPLTPDMARSALLQWFGDSQPYATLSWLLVAVAASAAVSVLRRAGGGPDRKQASVVLALLLPWALLPTVLLLVATAAGQPLYVARYSAVSASALVLLLAHGASSLRYRSVVPVVLLAALALPTFVAQRLPLANGTDWRDSAALVADWARPGDAFYFAQTGAAASPRLMLPVYREDFRGLEDMALWDGAAKLGALGDSVAPAPDAVPHLPPHKRVVVVADNVAPWWHSADADVFEKAGFAVVKSTQNATTTVILLRR